MKTLLIVLFCISSFANASDLSNNDIQREIAWQVLNIIDYGQTRDIAKHCSASERYELNQVLGSCPSISSVSKYFIINSLLHYEITAHLYGYRAIWQVGTLINTGYVVGRNFSLGLKINF